MATIGNRIRILRNSHNLTQEEFGKLFGIVKSTVSLYEHDKSTPNDQIKTDICRYFNVSMDYLLGLDEQKSGTLESKVSSLDKEMLQLFKNVPDDKKEEAMRYLRYLSEFMGEK